MSLSSDAFKPEGDIPLRHAQKPFRVTVQGGSVVCPGTAAGKENLSPPFKWANVPPTAKSLALIMVDDIRFVYPNAPVGTVFPHWSVFNIPPTANGLPEGVSPESPLPDGSVQGKNGYSSPYDKGYGGPCPPERERHLYIFTLYALDTKLALAPGSTYTAIVAAMKDHILAKAELKTYYTGQ
jgi:hypothetical protein